MSTVVEEYSLITNFASTLSSTQYVIDRQVEGLTHEDSVQQLPFRGNCLNWMLGHIVASRERMYTLLDVPFAWADDKYDPYRSGSEPITTSEEALLFEEILADLKSSTEALQEAANAASSDHLFSTPEGSERTIIQQLLGLTWHETYHAGQAEIYRQLAGKDDKIF